MIELDGTLEHNETTLDQIREGIEAVVGGKGFVYTFNVEPENGHVVSVVLTVVGDEQTARELADLLEQQLHSDNCVAGVLCRAPKVYLQIISSSHNQPSMAHTHNLPAISFVVVCLFVCLFVRSGELP